MSAVAKEAVEVVEVAADAVEETINALDHISNLNGTTRKQQIIVLVAVGVVAVATGAVISHYVTKKVMRTKFEMLNEQELEATREFYANREHIEIRADIEVPDPEEVLAATKAAGITDYHAISKKDKADSTESNEFLTSQAAQPGLADLVEKGKVAAVQKNAFDADQIPFWTAQNDKAIAEGEPFVISKEDFFENESEWTQLSYTFFEEDGVLADERENPVTDLEVVGTVNMARFGFLSEDVNTVYVTSPKHEIQIEVTRSTGSYAAEVHGFQHGDDVFEKRRGRVRFGED